MMNLLYKYKIKGVNIEIVSDYYFNNQYTIANNVLVIDMSINPTAQCYVDSSCKNCPMYLRKTDSCKASEKYIHTFYFFV